MKTLSCILVCCNSEIEKGNSVFHAIAGILNQNYPDFELIVMENSSVERNSRISALSRFIDEYNLQRHFPVSYQIVSYKTQLNVNSIRNRGANLARNEILIFTEDDTIIPNSNCFTEIANLARTWDFGFGAKRMWTFPGWFQQQQLSILDEIKQKAFDNLYKHSGNVPEEYKDSTDGFFFETIQGYTFIANFGFIKKTAFQKVKGFPVYSHLDMSDDCLMYRLFHNKFRFKSLNDQTVFHVSHFRSRKNNNRNLNRYFKELIDDGNYWCHTYSALGADFDETTIIEPLKACHYDYRLCDLYTDYKKSAPLNIQPTNQVLGYWQKIQALSLPDFALLIAEMQQSKSLDGFVSKSMADFDNLGRIVQLAIAHNFINISANGGITNCGLIPYKKIRKNVPNLTHEPNQALNQFPCDLPSRLRRATFIIKRYPMIEYMRFAIIGDDDLLSLHFSREENLIPVVIEADRRITDFIKINNPYAEVFNLDLLDKKEFEAADIPTVNSFITDPPYTYHGALLFIFRGLTILTNDQQQKEFYVILSEHMMGVHFQKLQQTLQEAGVSLYQVVSNFSQYPLPANYPELARADKLLTELDVERFGLKLSSSSNLYIFRTSGPNLNLLGDQIDYSKVYNHYAEI